MRSELDVFIASVMRDARMRVEGKIVNETESRARHVSTTHFMRMMHSREIVLRMHMVPLLIMTFLYHASKGKSLTFLVEFVALIYFIALFIYIRMTCKTSHNVLQLPGIFRVGRYFLTPSERTLYQLDNKLSRARAAVHVDKNAYTGLKNCCWMAVYGIRYGVFDCIGISGLTCLLLAENEHCHTIDIICPTGQGNLLVGHFFTVVNRNPAEGQFEDILSWNNECRIVDPWYNLNISIEDAKKDSDFLGKYPLLRTDNKMIYSFKANGVLPDYYQIIKDELEKVCKVCSEADAVESDVLDGRSSSPHLKLV